MRQGLWFLAWLAVSGGESARAQEWNIEKSTAPGVTLLDFVATEGTWISLDISPDGRSVAFDLLGHIYEMPIEGGNATALTSGRSWNMFPRYSPDGTRILFTSDRSGVEDQWALQRTTGQLTNLTKSDRSVYQGSWSADGRFVYASSLDDAERIQVLQFGLQGSRQELLRTGVFQPAVQVVDDTLRSRLYFEQNDQSLPASGARIKVYDKGSGQISVYLERPGGALNPSLSPDGRLLAYVHRNYQVTELVVHDLETREERVLVKDLDRDRQDYRVYQHGAYPNMAWHPNGTEVFVTFGGQIRAVNLRTGQARTIPFRAPVHRELDRTIRFPASVPDREAKTRSHRWAQRVPAGILFEALGDLYLKTEAGLRNLTSSPAHETSPIYSARTQTLYYASWTDDDLGAVYSRPLDGGTPTRLTTVPTQYGALAISADGRTLAFLRGSPALRQGVKLYQQNELELVLVGPDRRERKVTDVSWTDNVAARYPPTIRFHATRDYLYFTEFSGDTLLLKGIRTDGLDKSTLYRFPHAVRAVVSPDLRWVAFQEYFRTFVTPFEFVGKALTVSAFDRQGTSWRADTNDGSYATWSDDSRTLSWVRGAGFYEKSVDDIVAGRAAAGRTDLSFSYATAVPRSVIALTDVRVVTMDSGRRVLEGATVLVRENRIAAVGKGIPIPGGAKVFRLPGQTVIPGIVDVHAHYGAQSLSPLHVIEQRNAYLQAALAHGVTTLYEVYGNVEKDFWVSDMLRKGATVGPRLFSTGPGIYGSRFFRPKWYRVLSSLEDVRQAVSYNKDYGATALKDYLTPNRRVRHQLATVARELGLNVEVEPGGEAQTNFTRLIDGATGLAHGMGFTPIYSDVIKLFAATRIGVTPTLIVTLDGPSGESYFYESERVWENPKLLHFATREELVARSRPAHYWPEDQFAPRLAGIMKRLYDAGVSVQLGAHGQQLGLDAHWEMELYAQGGFSPLQVLQIATINGARHQGLDRDLGSIETGKLADLVVLRANPLENIRNARSIGYVMLNGVLYAGDDVARVYPDPAPAGRMYFQPVAR